MVAYLPASVRSIKARPNDKGSEQSDGGPNEFYLMAYQAKLIEEVS